MGGVASTIGRVASGVVTLGASEVARKTLGPSNLFSKGLQVPGMIVTGGQSADLVTGGTSNPNAPQVGGTVSPMQLLMNTGGAPLLSSIAMGSDPQTAIAAYFGVNPANFTDWMNSLDPASQSAISGLQANLNNIASNTQMKQSAIDKLVSDFPNFMQSEIPKYEGIADQATKDYATQALNQVTAKYAATGNISSGAMAAAVARTGAELGQENLQYGTNLALKNWQDKFNQSNALLSFQQKMMGNVADKGLSAVDTMLNINAGQARSQAGLDYNQSSKNQDTSNAMFGALGALTGNIAAPVAAKAGTTIANNLFGNTGGGTARSAPQPSDSFQLG